MKDWFSVSREGTFHSFGKIVARLETTPNVLPSAHALEAPTDFQQGLGQVRHFLLKRVRATLYSLFSKR